MESLYEIENGKWYLADIKDIVSNKLDVYYMMIGSSKEDAVLAPTKLGSNTMLHDGNDYTIIEEPSEFIQKRYLLVAIT